MAEARQRPPPGSLPVYVATEDEVAAGEIGRALELAGLGANVTWGSLGEALTEGAAAGSAILVVPEPRDAGHPDAAYAAIQDVLPDAAVIVLASPARRRPQILLWSGVDAVLLEPGARALVGPAALAVLAGYIVAPGAMRSAASPPPLSARERQMLDLVVEGLTNREIAQRLFLAESTVKRHLSSAFRRLGVHSRREAAAVMLASAAPVGSRIGARSPQTSS